MMLMNKSCSISQHPQNWKRIIVLHSQKRHQQQQQQQRCHNRNEYFIRSLSTTTTTTLTRNTNRNIHQRLNLAKSLVTSLNTRTNTTTTIQYNKPTIYQQQQHHQHLFFSTNRNVTSTSNSTTASASDIETMKDSLSSLSTQFVFPQATWSVESLQLHKNHNPISYNELTVLAKRAVIDINTLESKQCIQLQQDVGNMLHMIEQVMISDIKEENNTGMSILQQQKDTLTTSDLYDTPRGVHAVPLRDDDATNDNSTNSKELQQIYKEYETVWTSYLQPNTKRIGSHNYFVIASSATTSLPSKSSPKKLKSSSATSSFLSTDDDA
jgi:hypothetical protein